MIQSPPPVVFRCSEKTPFLALHVEASRSSCDSDVESAVSYSSYMQAYGEIGSISDAGGDASAEEHAWRASRRRRSRVGCAWSRARVAMRSLRKWFTACLGERDSSEATAADDGCYEHKSPLLARAAVFTPRHAAVSFLKTATSRKMRDQNRRHRYSDLESVQAQQQ